MSASPCRVIFAANMTGRTGLALTRVRRTVGYQRASNGTFVTTCIWRGCLRWLFQPQPSSAGSSILSTHRQGCRERGPVFNPRGARTVIVRHDSLIIIPSHEPSGSSSWPLRRTYTLRAMRASRSGNVFIYQRHLHMFKTTEEFHCLLHNILLRLQGPELGKGDPQIAPCSAGILILLRHEILSWWPKDLLPFLLPKVPKYRERSPERASFRCLSLRRKTCESSLGRSGRRHIKRRSAALHSISGKGVAVRLHAKRGTEVYIQQLLFL